jgi:hypothetical protein
MPKCYQNVVRNTKNQTLFNVSVPLLKDQFLKRDFFDSFNGLCYLRVGGLKLAIEMEKPQRRENAQKNVATTTRPLHAMLC